jgi:hypothetical protein
MSSAQDCLLFWALHGSACSVTYKRGSIFWVLLRLVILSLHGSICSFRGLQCYKRKRHTHLLAMQVGCGFN